MLRRTAILVLSAAVIFSTASCQTQTVQVPFATLTTALPSSEHIRTSEETSEIVPSPSQMPAKEAAPTITASPAASSDLPVCFTPADLIPVAFMPDGAGLAIRTGSGVQIFNLETRQEESFVKAPGNVFSAALSSDGSRLAWSLDDNTIQLVQISDQQVLKTLEGHTDAVTKLRFSPTGEELVSASHDRWVRIWDMDGDELGAFQPEGDVLGIGISPDGSQLATVPFDGPIELWDLSSMQKIASLGGTGGYDTSDAVFSPGGQYLAADLATGLFLWRISDGELVWNEIKNSMAVAFSPDGRYLAYSDVDDQNKVFLSSPDGVQTIRTMEGTPGGPVWELMFSPDSSMLASTNGAEMRIWGVEDGRLLYVGKPTCP